MLNILCCLKGFPQNKKVSGVSRLLHCTSSLKNNKAFCLVSRVTGFLFFLMGSMFSYLYSVLSMSYSNVILASSVFFLNKLKILNLLLSYIVITIWGTQPNKKFVFLHWYLIIKAYWSYPPSLMSCMLYWCYTLLYFLTEISAVHTQIFPITSKMSVFHSEK